jgi:sugar (pentulose or hexulose) kinase
MHGIITVDIGTSSMRAILHAADGHIVHIDQRENMPEFFNDGRVEQDPAAWQNVLLAVLKSCAQAAAGRGIEAACISVTAQRSSVIPVDESGTPLHPAIMWQDRRTAGLARDMEAHNALVYGKTGLKISPVFSALKMTWLRRNRPDVWKKTYKMIGIQDWVLYLLSGWFVTDHSFGSRTNLLDLEKRCWDADLLALFEVEPRMLCDLIAPGSIVGGLTPEIARATGLAGGLPVVSAGGDQQCAALGLGLFSGERAASNTGTGSYLIGHADQPAFDPGMRLNCNVSAVPGAYIVEAAVLTSGAIYRWFNESLLAGGAGKEDPFAAINAEAQRVPPGANDLLLLPHFKGCGSPYWDPEARGVFYNVTLSTSRGEMARAILEGIAVEMKESLALVENLCGAVRSVSVSGGMTKSELFNQIQSDIFERPIVRFSNNEATSLGAWIAGTVATGLETSYPGAFARATGDGDGIVYQPDPANRHIYERQCRRSRALYQALAARDFREAMQ